MKKFLSIKPYSPDFALLLLRVIPFAFLAINHGIGKWDKLMAGGEIKFYTFGGAVPAGLSLGLATFAELICAILIIIGLFTRPAVVLVIITMLVAAFGAHSDSPFKEGEHALLFAAAALPLLFTGPGRYSVDKMIFK